MKELLALILTIVSSLFCFNPNGRCLNDTTLLTFKFLRDDVLQSDANRYTSGCQKQEKKSRC